MKNISTRKLLAGTFTILALLVLLVSLLALRSLNAADLRFSSYVTGIAHRKALTAEIGIAASRRAIGVREMVLVHTGADRDRVFRARAKYRGRWVTQNGHPYSWQDSARAVHSHRS